MKLDVRGLSIAVGTVIAAAFSVCAFFVAVAPEGTAAFLGYLLHINLSGLTRALTWPSYFAGASAVHRLCAAKGTLTRGLGYFLGGYYARWCTQRMVDDAVRHFISNI